MNNQKTEERHLPEQRVRCAGACFQGPEDKQKRCCAYGHHEWCENYMVRLSLGKPEFFEEALCKEEKL